MKNVFRVSDIYWADVGARRYDIAIFACGYEKRARHVPGMLDRTIARHILTLYFEELLGGEERRLNERFYSSAWPNSVRIDCSGNDDGPLLTALRALEGIQKPHLRIIVDYTSMSRLWYAAILNWARYTPLAEAVTVDFVYAFGRYLHRAIPMVIRDIVAIPGCEGVAANSARSLAVFGLGFDQLATMCVLERLEPDQIYTFLAAPSRVAGYDDKVRSLNDEVLAMGTVNLDLPANSVEQTYRALLELIKPHLGLDSLTIIPMGPKPHVLASILASIRAPEVSCLRVSSVRHEPDDIEAAGEIAITQIIIKPVGKSILDVI